MILNDSMILCFYAAPSPLKEYCCWLMRWGLYTGYNERWVVAESMLSNICAVHLCTFSLKQGMVHGLGQVPVLVTKGKQQMDSRDWGQLASGHFPDRPRKLHFVELLEELPAHTQWCCLCGSDFFNRGLPFNLIFPDVLLVSVFKSVHFWKGYGFIVLLKL